MKYLQAEAIESGELEATKPLPWYPKNLAWHSNFSRKEISKNQILERFHEFLKLETEVGNMTRQESVSMIILFSTVSHFNSTLFEMAVDLRSNG
ncbi:unnamed protein product [Arabidopsis lyrata]|nr:unnamed protein product [Arabidopsis lyrata]